MDSFVPDIITTILKNATSFQWTVQGLGMMRMYINDRIRLHVWDKSLVTPNVTQIHDHPWDFKSTIICGYIINHLYVPAPYPVNYVCQQIVCGAGGGPIATPFDLHLHKIENPIRYVIGNQYYQKSFEIHSTEFGDGTVTLIERFFNQNRDVARVFYKKTDEYGWVSAEPRPATTEEVKTITSKALKLFKGKGGTS